MNDTKKEFKNTQIDKKALDDKLENLNRLLLGLNAFGSLELIDYNLILSYLKGAFHYVPIDDYDQGIFTSTKELKDE